MKKRLFRYTRTVVPLTVVALLVFAGGCSKGTMDGSSPVSNAGDTNQVPPFTGPDPNQYVNVRQKAADADSYAITYGALTPAVIDTLKTYPLVIVHPYNGNITRDQIMWIKQGVKPDDATDNPVVLCYISIGEDSRTYQMTDAQMQADPRFRGDGTGPTVDPRGPGPSNRSLVGLNPKGTPTNGGYASYYVNDNAVNCPGTDRARVPDENGNFKTRFVNAGDPLWYATAKEMLMNVDTHTPPGLRELLTSSYGRGLGCDGVFLDTIDTAAPNRYTTCSDSNHSNSEWTAQGFSNFIASLRSDSDFPNKVILQNRGLFFFDPREPHYQVSAMDKIDIGFFESYHLDNDSATTVSPYYPDNRYNMAPKVMAEANRHGFKMLSLGYADGFGGPKPGMSLQTLLGNSGNGFDILLADIQEASAVGFRHYITNAQVDFVNSFVKSHEVLSDTTPPIWSSTYNNNYDFPVAAPNANRVGIQKAEVSADGSVVLSWDVALDMNRVSYVLYHMPTPFNFSAAARVPIIQAALGVGSGYDLVWQAPNPNLALQSVYPYQFRIRGLQHGIEYGFAIRAIDSKGNEDNNQVVLTATP